MKINTFPQTELSHDELGQWVKKIYSKELTDIPDEWGKASMYVLNKKISIESLIKLIKPKTMLDYGCGQSTVIETLQQTFPQIDYAKYDPFVDEYNNYPTGYYDFITCCLVLHLLNKDILSHTIQELHRLSLNYVFVTVVIYETVDSSLEIQINHWINNFNTLFKIVTKEIMPRHVYPNSKDMYTVHFLLKKLTPISIN